jgi:hypothetical protein
MKKLIILISFFSIIPSFCKAQTFSKSNCDSLHLWIYPDKANDTVTYEFLKKWTGALYAMPYDVSGPTHTEVNVYEMTINNEEKMRTTPGFSHFRHQTLKKQGGTITITNCRVKCWHDEIKPEEPNSLISKAVFYVLPAQR